LTEPTKHLYLKFKLFSVYPNEIRLIFEKKSKNILEFFRKMLKKIPEYLSKFQLNHAE
jgi:hypothetical protein